MGPLTAWRRMVVEDRAARWDEEIEFILHLGDFVYETVWYPEDRPNGYFDRTLVDRVRFPRGERHDDYHVPADLEDYRTLYRRYLEDPDLQAARARWPFVAIWDNGEFSDKGWQSLQRFGSATHPAQTRKVAANQAWFEYIPARVRTSRGQSDVFSPPAVNDAPIDRFDDDGLGLEPNNLAALSSLTGYRAQRWGHHVELLLTDQRSYRSDDFGGAAGAATISSKTYPQMVPFETLRMIDAGRQWNSGSPPASLQFGDGKVDNFRATGAPRTLLGRTQREWFLCNLAASTATWKIWGNTIATFDMRADPQNLPKGLVADWPGEGYAGFPRTDFSTAFAERSIIFDHVRRHKVTGFVTLSGDRHSFWAGYSSKDLPPEGYDPVGVNFVTGSLSSPGMVEALEHSLAKTHPLRSLYLVDRDRAEHPAATVNLLLKEGVRSALDYARRGDLAGAKSLANPGNAPHVEFVDMAGHGYSVCTASAQSLAVDFICIERPVVDDGTSTGSKLRYRASFETAAWDAGGRPKVDVISIARDEPDTP